MEKLKLKYDNNNYDNEWAYHVVIMIVSGDNISW